MSNKDTFSGIGIGLAIGLVLGAAVGILYAPKSGKETRRIIKDKAEKVGADIRAKLGKGTIKDAIGH